MKLVVTMLNTLGNGVVILLLANVFLDVLNSRGMSFKQLFSKIVVLCIFFLILLRI